MSETHKHLDAVLEDLQNLCDKHCVGLVHRPGGIQIVRGNDADDGVTEIGTLMCVSAGRVAYTLPKLPETPAIAKATEER